MYSNQLMTTYTTARPSKTIKFDLSVLIVWMSYHLFITIPLSFGCCDEEMFLFLGQIKEILILNYCS